ncbi:hypothetical protein I600_1993 [Maribacter dokdonensis DSW-8]|nr:hypothetical protein I600_1993 [Maribacter dokdonensis DSW-8]
MLVNSKIGPLRLTFDHVPLVDVKTPVLEPESKGKGKIP